MQALTHQVNQSTEVVLLARIKASSTQYLTQTDPSTGVDGVELAVSDVTDPEAPVAGAYSDIGVATVFDALQTDSYWDLDEVGYNFRYKMPASKIPDGGKLYEVEVKLTPKAGDPFAVIWTIATRKRAALTP